MIRTFADKETARVWAGTPSRRLPMDVQRVARRKRAEGDAHDVQIVDYH